MDEIISEILAVPTGNDFVRFEAKPTAPIAMQREYHGVSTQITGYIKNVRLPFSVDIGVGDIIVPGTTERVIQTQLEGFSTPEILTYSLESTISEKLDAILQRFELTSRMKDFYDIYYISRTFDFEGDKLLTALQKTFENRRTPYAEDRFTRVLALAEDEDMNIKWRHFLRTLGNPEITFRSVTDAIGAFLQPVWDALIQNQTLNQKWNATESCWLL